MDFITFIVTPLIIFFIGLSGLFLNRKNILLIIMSIELMLLSVNFILLISSSYLDDRFSQIFAIFILTVAAAESSIGLSILVVYFRLKGSINIELVRLLRG
jgi:NADH-quinone oxidoreductase subunit K|tara:strand:- start:20512 stop:20814 length:303 start_codon:yes stop_codon:yes gene_type:complete